MSDGRYPTVSRGRLFLWFEILMIVGLSISFIPGFETGILGYVKTQISFNSEAFALALLVSIDLRTHRKSMSRKWPVLWWSLLVIAYLATVWLDGLSGDVVTLNESLLGALLISIFLTIFGPSNDRRWGLRWAFPLIAVMIALLGELLGDVWANAADWIMRNAETLGFAILISLLFGYLTSYPWPVVRPSRIARLLWILSIVLVPLVVAAINPHGVDSAAAVGPIESLMVWIQRITESFIAALLVTGLCWLLEMNHGSGEGGATQTAT